MTNAKTVWSRDGQWAYDLAGCGYGHAVTHLPTGRTLRISGSLALYRKLAKTGELLRMVDRAYTPTTSGR